MNVPVKPAIAAFLVLAAALAVGQRFGFRWAGGTGYEAPRVAEVWALQGDSVIDRNGTTRPLSGSSTIARGETVRTGDRGYVILNFVTNGGTAAMAVSLAERTDVQILRNDAGGLALNLERGRLIVNTNGLSLPVEVQTGNTRTRFTGGAVAFVHYDFKWQADVVPLGGSIVITDIRGTKTETDKPRLVSTNGAFDAKPETVDLARGAGAAFYAWVQARDPFH